MNCPRCSTESLAELDRDGLVIDRCPVCRGIWLDRGELERLLARGAREADAATRSPREIDDDFDDDDDDDRPHHSGRPGLHHRRHDGHGGSPPPRKKRWFEALGDLLD